MASKISYEGKRNQIKKKFSFIENGHQLEKLEFALAVAQTNGAVSYTHLTLPTSHLV